MAASNLHFSPAVHAAPRTQKHVIDHAQQAHALDLIVCLTNDNSAAQVASDRNSTDDLYSAGKSMFVAMIAVVTAEIGLIARFWTWEFCLCAFFSYALVSGLPGPRSRDLVESRPSPELL